MTYAQMFILLTAIYIAPNLNMLCRTLMAGTCLLISVYIQFFA